MSDRMRYGYAPILHWFVRKNPLYLLSAAVMAAASRLCIADAGAAAGEVHLIVLTLLVLQAYEWAVAGLLLLLHRFRRAPEDEPSLMIVAALFWTGPIAATIEMTVLDAGLGSVLAAIVAVVAFAELVAMNACLRLSFQAPAWVLASLTLIHLACLPALLRMTVGPHGLHELVLYCVWWVFAAYLPIVSWGPRDRLQLAFMLILAGATSVHLAGMNHAFFCHASAFYSSPALISLAFVMLRIEARGSVRRPGVFVTAAFLPLAAVGLCMQGFSGDVPVADLPRFIADPMIVVAFAAAAVWYYAYLLRRSPILLHVGTAAVAFAFSHLLSLPPASVHTPMPWWVMLYVAVLYLVCVSWLRRSRADLLAAITLHALGISALIAGRLDGDGLIIKGMVAWSAMAAIHIAYRRPKLWLRILPVLILIQASWAARGTAIGLVHTGITISGLIVLGLIFRWTRYLEMGLALAAAAITVVLTASITRIARPRAGLTLVGAFLLLAAGAAISWWKTEWLHRLSRNDVVDDDRASP